MAFEYYTNYGAFIRPNYYTDYDYDVDPSFYNFGAKFLDQVAAIWVGSDPTQFAYIELEDNVNLTAGHTKGNIDVFTYNVNLSQFNGSISASGTVSSDGGVHVLSAKKNFDIPHPSKSGWRLRHTCLEGPKNDVYIRGRVINQNQIELPLYWKDFVDISTISVNITPIGSNQEIYVNQIQEDKIILQSNGNKLIDCFYTVYAERKDGEKLISEYEGATPEDYPGNNDEYSVSGYHYDIKL